MEHYNVEIFSDEHLIVKVDGLVIKNVCLSIIESINLQRY